MHICDAGRFGSLLTSRTFLLQNKVNGFGLADRPEPIYSLALIDILHTLEAFSRPPTVSTIIAADLLLGHTFLLGILSEARAS